MKRNILNGIIHSIPDDLYDALSADQKAITAWESLTPLARNEWICWVISVKKIETRQQHIDRLIIDLQNGKRRPCCWMGCIHRTGKPLSSSVKHLLNKNHKDSNKKS